MGLPNSSRETKFSGVNGDREILIFPVQLITSRIGNLTRLIHTLAKCMTMCVNIPFILNVRLMDGSPGATQDFSTFLLRCLP